MAHIDRSGSLQAALALEIDDSRKHHNTMGTRRTFACFSPPSSTAPLLFLSPAFFVSAFFSEAAAAFLAIVYVAVRRWSTRGLGTTRFKMNQGNVGLQDNPDQYKTFTPANHNSQNCEQSHVSGQRSRAQKFLGDSKSTQIGHKSDEPSTNLNPSISPH